jgi:hypothetical protein
MQLLRDLHLAPSEKPVVYQDNKSTMLLAVTHGSFARTKHLTIKQSFIKQGLQRKEFRICWLPTTEMLADWQTKPLTAPHHLKIAKKLHMCMIVSSSR